MSNPTGWFYRQQGKTVGPVSETDLDALVQNGTLTPETFIWQKGLPQWQRYRELRGAAAESAPAAASQTPPAESGGAWYYVLNGQTVGPVSEAELDALVQNGTLPPDTFVFCQGMNDWQAYSAVKAAASTAPAPVLPVLKIGPQSEPAKPGALRVSVAKTNPPATSAPPVVKSAPVLAASQPANSAAASDMAVCAGCGKVDNPQAFQHLGEAIYCPKCHRQTAERLRHEALIKYSSPAGFWIRFLARILDTVVICVLVGILSFALVIIGFPVMRYANDLKDARNHIMGVTTILTVIAIYCVPLAYYTVMHGLWGASLGKLALRLRVVHVSGAKIGLLRAFLRVLAEIVAIILGNSLCALFAKYVLVSMVEKHPLLVIVLLLVVAIPLTFINYLWAMFSEEKFAWHDILARTRVLKLT